MSSPQADRIAGYLRTVAELRAGRTADPALGVQVTALKRYQALRFERCYADLLATPRYGGAARFFLEELYGPQEFAERDAQFGRIVPGLVRVFPQEIVGTVEKLGQLHALSEALDDTAAQHLPRRAPGSLPSAADYVRVWQATGRAAAREQQIELTLAIGRALEGYTRSRMMRTTLRLMRGPAQAAGLAALQRFLEAGFDAFGAMKGADEFLACVGERERALAAALFAPDAAQALAAGLPPLSVLP
jgi:hypothetical protein